MNVETNPEIDLPAKPGQEIQHIPQNGGTVQTIDGGMMKMLDMIERASRDPSVDVAKFKQLTEIGLQLEDRLSERQFNIAMNEAQQEMAPIRADADNDQTKTKYASHVALDRAIRPIYTSHGFSVTFNTEPSEKTDEVIVTADVLHTSKHFRHYRIPIPADGKGAKGGDVMTKTHAAMAAVSYGKRGLLGMIFNIAVDRDDDGNAAGGTFITEAQVEELKELISTIDAELKKVGLDIHVNVAALCKKVGADNIACIPAKKYKTLTQSLRQWGRDEITKAKKAKRK